MLTKLGQRGYSIREESEEYSTDKPDRDSDAKSTQNRGRNRNRNRDRKGIAGQIDKADTDPDTDPEKSEVLT